MKYFLENFTKSGMLELFRKHIYFCRKEQKRLWNRHAFIFFEGGLFVYLLDNQASHTFFLCSTCLQYRSFQMLTFLSEQKKNGHLSVPVRHGMRWYIKICDSCKTFNCNHSKWKHALTQYYLFIRNCLSGRHVVYMSCHRFVFLFIFWKPIEIENHVSCKPHCLVGISAGYPDKRHLKAWDVTHDRALPSICSVI